MASSSSNLKDKTLEDKTEPPLQFADIQAFNNIIVRAAQDRNGPFYQTLQNFSEQYIKYLRYLRANKDVKFLSDVIASRIVYLIENKFFIDKEKEIAVATLQKIHADIAASKKSENTSSQHKPIIQIEEDGDDPIDRLVNDSLVYIQIVKSYPDSLRRGMGAEISELAMLAPHSRAYSDVALAHVESINAIISQGLDHVNKKEWQLAINCFQQSLEKCKEDDLEELNYIKIKLYYCHYNLAIQTNQNDPKAAISILEKVILRLKEIIPQTPEHVAQHGGLLAAAQCCYAAMLVNWANINIMRLISEMAKNRVEQSIAEINQYITDMKTAISLLKALQPNFADLSNFANLYFLAQLALANNFFQISGYFYLNTALARQNYSLEINKYYNLAIQALDEISPSTPVTIDLKARCLHCLAMVPFMQNRFMGKSVLLRQAMQWDNESILLLKDINLTPLPPQQKSYIISDIFSVTHHLVWLNIKRGSELNAQLIQFDKPIDVAANDSEYDIAIQNLKIYVSYLSMLIMNLDLEPSEKLLLQPMLEKCKRDLVLLDAERRLNQAKYIDFKSSQDPNLLINNVNYADAHADYGNTLLQQRQYAGAIAAYEVAIRGLTRTSYVPSNAAEENFYKQKLAKYQTLLEAAKKAKLAGEAKADKEQSQLKEPAEREERQASLNRTTTLFNETKTDPAANTRPAAHSNFQTPKK